MNGLDTPHVRRFPLAVGQTRYAGEWIAAVVADTRALAEDATEKLRVVYEPLPFVMKAEEALQPNSPPVHPAHGSNVLLDRCSSGATSTGTSPRARAICRSASPGDAIRRCRSRPLA